MAGAAPKLRNCLGYDTRSVTSALFMAGVDALNPFRASREFSWGRKCVVSSLAGLGDLFIHLPLIEGIVAHCRDSGVEVSVALRPPHMAIGQQCGWDTFTFDNALEQFFKAPREMPIGKVWGRIAHVRAIHPDLWIDLTGNALSALMIKLAGVRALASRTTRGGTSMVTHVLPHSLQENEYANRNRVAAYLGCEIRESVFSKLPRATVYQQTVVLGATTACRWRNWPMESYLEVVRAFPHARFALVGHSHEVTSPDSEALQRLIAEANVINLLDQLSVADLIALIASARAVVSNDTSGAHIAAAFKKEGAVIFGPGNSTVFAAPGGLKLFHDQTCPFYPCVQWKCHQPSEWCMQKVTARAVIQHLRTVLG